MENYTKLEEIIGYSFKNKKFLKEALTHRSYLNENSSWGVDHNERLEFLGDAVLELAVSRFLFLSQTEYSEGQLTSYRAALVNSHMLSKVAQAIKLEDFVLLSRGEKRDTGRARKTIVANAVESIIGAIYLDNGFDEAYAFVEKFILSHVEEIKSKRLWKDPKSYLQEIIQDKKGLTPSYEVLDEWGPDHKKVFKIGVYFANDLIAQGEGPSKQEAEIRAAEKALEQFQKE